MDGTKRRRCLSWHSCVVGGGAAKVGRREGRVGVEEGPVRPVRQRPCALVLCEGMRIFCVSKMRRETGEVTAVPWREMYHTPFGSGTQ